MCNLSPHLVCRIFLSVFRSCLCSLSVKLINCFGGKIYASLNKKFPGRENCLKGDVELSEKLPHVLIFFINPATAVPPSFSRVLSTRDIEPSPYLKLLRQRLRHLIVLLVSKWFSVLHLHLSIYSRGINAHYVYGLFYTADLRNS